MPYPPHLAARLGVPPRRPPLGVRRNGTNMDEVTLPRNGVAAWLDMRGHL